MNIVKLESQKKLELLESRPLREWDNDLLPKDVKVSAEMCDETEELMLMIWRKVA